MNKFQFKNNFEKGQVIPLVIVMFFVIIGMVVLILDGGALMSNRRTAQAAADAGALAGAQRACLGKDDAESVAADYASANGASSALVTVTGMQITVNATVEHPSYFAKIFGDPTLEASAEASAGCYGVCGKEVIPVAWRCPSLDGGEPECQMQTLSWKLIEPLLAGRVTSVYIDGKEYFKSGTNIVDASTIPIPPDQIYIVFNSDKLCIGEVGGTIQCDLDGDTKNEIQLGGQRGYLYLDSGSIPDWIKRGPYPDLTLNAHTWLTGKSGSASGIELAMIDMEFPGKVVMVPVYNAIPCKYPISPEPPSICYESVHVDPWPAGADNYDYIVRNNQDNYHIIAFAPFYISCISTQSDGCPGSKQAQGLDNNDSVIEGYFLTDVDVSPDYTQYCSINLGNCTVSLTK